MAIGDTFYGSYDPVVQMAFRYASSDCHSDKPTTSLPYRQGMRTAGKSPVARGTKKGDSSARLIPYLDPTHCAAEHDPRFLTGDVEPVY